jgi:glycosyltransferase involved in cell wall biosynthesis
LTHAKGETHEKVREDLDIVWFPWLRVQGRLAEIDFFTGNNIFALLSLIYNGVKYSRKVIDQKKIDLVICLWVIPSGLYLYVNSLLRLIRTPYILWALGSDINKYRQNFFANSLLKKIIGRSAYVFADGFGLCSSIREISGMNCEFLPTFRKISRNSDESGYVSGNCVSFLYVGRHVKVKGIDLLMNAIIRLEKSYPDLKYRVIIAGEGELTAQITSMATENGLDNKVIFTGKISDDYLFELYSRTDCVIIPSRSESIPVVLSEALQFNKPMIVTDVGDMGVIGKRYGVARVINKESADALAQAMYDFIGQPFEIDPVKKNELLSLLMMENSFNKLLDIILETGQK